MITETAYRDSVNKAHDEDLHNGSLVFAIALFVCLRCPAISELLVVNGVCNVLSGPNALWRSPSH